MISLKILRTVRCKHLKNIIISYLNINSARNKLQNLGTLIGDLVDVLCISETKLDRSFPTSQFMLAEFKRPYRLDKTSTSEGLLTFIRNDIPSRQLTGFHWPNGIQILPIELNLKKAKWVIFDIYRHPNQSIQYFLEFLSNAILFYS